jgi:hypothetical protein
MLRTWCAQVLDDDNTLLAMVMAVPVSWNAGNGFNDRRVRGTRNALPIGSHVILKEEQLIGSFEYFIERIFIPQLCIRHKKCDLSDVCGL